MSRPALPGPHLLVIQRRGGASRGGVAIMLWALAGCVTVLAPPRLEHDAEMIYLLDHGRHRSLVLPDEQGGAVRWAYGDWTWFAEGDTGFPQAVRALLWPTEAALGRQSLEAWHSPAALKRQVPESFVQVLVLEAPAPAVRRLAERLDALYRAGHEQAIYNPDFGLTFVPHPERYWIFNNSNSVTAGWLESLGVEVRGSVWFSVWRVP